MLVKKKSSLIILLFLLIIISGVVKAESDFEAESVILLEPKTRDIVYEKNSQQTLPPASITKIMTMLLTMEALNEGEIALSDVVLTSNRAASMGGSQIWLEPGEEMSLEDLLKAVAIVSANDACVAIAEHISGSEEDFVKKMNQKAEELGLKNTYFHNTNGLPVSGEGVRGNYTTAYDIAIMGSELLKHSKILAYTSTWIDYLRAGDSFLRNTNDLLKLYNYTDGLKTGFTNESGFCVAATAKKDGMRFIAVILNAPDSKIRFKEAERLLKKGFSLYQPLKVVEEGEVIEQLSIIKGRKEEISTIAAKDIVIPILKDEKKEIKKEIIYTTRTAPIKKGEVVGQINVLKNGKILAEVEIIAEEDVDKANFLILMLQLLKRLINEVIIA